MRNHLDPARPARAAFPRIVPGAARAVAACLAGMVLATTLPTAAGAATAPTAVAAATAVVPSVTVDQRLVTKQVVKAGQTLTLTLDKLPANVATAKVVVGAEGAVKATKISTCAGAVATTACTAKPQLTTPVRTAGYAHVTLDMTKADRKVTFHNASADAALTIRLASYTVAAGTTTTTAVVPKVPSKPGPTNTGVPAGTKLTVHEGDLVITQPNTVIDAKEIRGIVWVRAAGVVIKRSLITGRHTPTDLALVMVQGAGSVTIEDTEMYAKYPNAHIRGVIGQNFTLRRANVHDVIDQMVIIGDNVTVEDSWLHHNLYYLQDPNYNNTPSHDDNAQISIGNNLKFLRNTMEGTHNASIQVTQDRGPVSNLVLDGNYIGNGGCAVNLAQKKHGAMTGFVVRNNVFTPNQIHRGCAMIVDRPTIPLMALSNNTWTDGKPVTITPRG